MLLIQWVSTAGRTSQYETNRLFVAEAATKSGHCDALIALMAGSASDWPAKTQSITICRFYDVQSFAGNLISGFSSNEQH